MSRLRGVKLEGTDHIRQSIKDILTTPIGSRVMLHEYGSRLSELIDAPMNELFDVELHASVAEALDRWEPRFKLTAVWIEGRSSEGSISLGLEGVVLSEGRVIKLEGVTL